MSENLSNNRKLAKNAILLYIRMFVSMAIGFYTSRIVLQALGISDYGIYNLVGGLIIMINALTSALSGATSRFITYSMGEENQDAVSKAFSTAFIIHCSLALFFLLVAETVGLWFVNNHLVIEPSRMVAANWIYQSAIISTVLGITQVPYNAIITAHERFGVFAYIDILNSVLKLLIAFVVLYSVVDKLIEYSILYMLISAIVILFYRYYCVKHFRESLFVWRCDKNLLKEMLSFSGWNLYGNMMLTISQQGQNVLLNRFFGTIINAASGIALQIQATLFAFIGNIAFAFRPQIVKEYAKNNNQRVNYLVFLASKFSAISTLLISVPVIFNMHYLMSLWLAKVPSGSVEICQLLLITNFFNSFNPSSYNAITATGKLKLVNILSGTFFLLQLPLIYIILHYTHSYYNVYLLGITIPIMTCIMYIYVLKKYVNIFNAKGFVVNIMIPTTIIGLLDAVIIYCCGKLGMNNLFLFVIDIIISSLIIILLSYLWILDRHEKFVLLSYIKSKF